MSRVIASRNVVVSRNLAAAVLGVPQNIWTQKIDLGFQPDEVIVDSIDNIMTAGTGVGFVICDQISGNPCCSFIASTASYRNHIFSAKSLNPTTQLKFTVARVDANVAGQPNTYLADTTFVGVLTLHLRFVKYA